MESYIPQIENLHSFQMPTANTDHIRDHKRNLNTKSQYYRPHSLLAVNNIRQRQHKRAIK
jgi:hypothetical protein